MSGRRNYGRPSNNVSLEEDAARRRQIREDGLVADIWATSPSEPDSIPSAHQKRRHKSRSKHKSSHRKHHSKSYKRKSRSSKYSSSDSSPSFTSESSESEDHRKRRKRSSKKRKHRYSESSYSDSESMSENSDVAREKQYHSRDKVDAFVETREGNHEKAKDKTVDIERERKNTSSVEGAKDSAVKNVKSIGPSKPASLNIRAESYGMNLRPGEGSAIAAYVQEGKRIPRRGEIGLRSEEIESYENAGYVMSGSRNRRMEAVRVRKESQVYSAEERAALARFNYEDKEAREKRTLAQFRKLVQSKSHNPDIQNPE
uniref:NF-kappa-B-activating protein C-terminal domain-containing protein n=1 Tax=Timspurckia oligopyrenoides TaxID=708627 RepID=A0A7S0ZLF9_9RHOD|mmetsp:Transcript_9846/g.17754  ORF Transcript_9846/g.17754 Transcript_9846/m.17754 type:complete len:315 (+) Transcript_9846:27-971(+)